MQRSQYIRIKNPLHKRSEKACMCFNTRRASTRDYTVYEFWFSTANWGNFQNSLCMVAIVFLFPNSDWCKRKDPWWNLLRQYTYYGIFWRMFKFGNTINLEMEKWVHWRIQVIFLHIYHNIQCPLYFLQGSIYLCLCWIW